MPKKITVLGAVAALAVAANLQDAQAFAPAPSLVKSSPLTLFAEEPTEAVFKPVEEVGATDEPQGEDIPLEAAEQLGRGAAKVGYATSCYGIIRFRAKRSDLTFLSFTL